MGIPGDDPAQDAVGGVRLGPINWAHCIEEMKMANVCALISVMDPSEEDNTPTDRDLIKVTEPLDLEATDFRRVLDVATDFIDKHRKKGQVYIYCRSGIIRSGAVAIGYAMRTLNMTLREAWEMVREHRSCVLPNEAYFNCLLELEQELYPGKPATMEVEDQHPHALMARCNKRDQVGQKECFMALRKYNGDLDKAWMYLSGYL